MRMLKIFVPALLALMLLAGTATSIAAQDVDGPASGLDMPGLEKAYGRTFSADMMAMVDPENPDAKPAGWFMLTTMLLEFDSEDSAKAGFELMNEQASSDAAGDDVQLEDVELDLDMEYTAKQAMDEVDGVTTNVILVTAQDGEYVYAVSGITFGDDPSDVVVSTVTGVQGADASDDEEQFHEDGTSMGGLWAKMPGAEGVQEQVESLTDVSDVIYFPSSEGTPAA